MPLLNFSKTSKVTGDGWTEERLRQAWKLVLNNDSDLDPSAMTHKEFCDAWADYTLTQINAH